MTIKSDTLLLRQISPSFIQEGRVTSQAFRPTLKDDFRLSVENGDQIEACSCWERFCAQDGCKSSGVRAVSHDECSCQELDVIEDGEGVPEHCSIDFSSFGKSEINKKAKYLSRLSEKRGWLFQP